MPPPTSPCIAGGGHSREDRQGPHVRAHGRLLFSIEGLETATRSFSRPGSGLCPHHYRSLSSRAPLHQQSVLSSRVCDRKENGSRPPNRTGQTVHGMALCAQAVVGNDAQPQFKGPERCWRRGLAPYSSQHLCGHPPDRRPWVHRSSAGRSFAGPLAVWYPLFACGTDGN